mmetsp:Transcript_20018/g.31757  ORF Transcript_20018/g.31757 Transcript_20018/m.31757 type:complete len:221 (+) Transcript_20018:527-1189(+)
MFVLTRKLSFGPFTVAIPNIFSSTPPNLVIRILLTTRKWRKTHPSGSCGGRASFLSNFPSIVQTPALGLLEQVIIRFESLVKAILVTSSPSAVTFRMASICFEWYFHIRTFPSSPPVAIISPDGLNSSAVTCGSSSSSSSSPLVCLGWGSEVEAAAPGITVQESIQSNESPMDEIKKANTAPSIDTASSDPQGCSAIQLTSLSLLLKVAKGMSAQSGLTS